MSREVHPDHPRGQLGDTCENYQASARAEAICSRVSPNETFIQRAIHMEAGVAVMSDAVHIVKAARQDRLAIRSHGDRIDDAESFQTRIVTCVDRAICPESSGIRWRPRDSSRKESSGQHLAIRLNTE